MSSESILDAIGAVLPAIEIVDSRFQDWTSVGALNLIADSACNAGWVYGEPTLNWREIDYPKHEMHLSVNGDIVRNGTGSAVMGNPLDAFVWLAKELSKNGNGITKGCYITTGVCSEVYLAEPGDRVSADFGSIGSVTVKFL